MPLAAANVKRQAESKAARARIVGAASDHMILHHLYEDWRDVVGLRPWFDFTQPSFEEAAHEPDRQAGLEFGKLHVASHSTLAMLHGMRDQLRVKLAHMGLLREGVNEHARDYNVVRHVLVRSRRQLVHCQRLRLHCWFTSACLRLYLIVTNSSASTCAVFSKHSRCAHAA